jgi:hypothetical protein
MKLRKGQGINKNKKLKYTLKPCDFYYIIVTAWEKNFRSRRLPAAAVIAAKAEVAQPAILRVPG